MSRDAGLDFDPSQSRRRLVGENRNREPGQTLKGGVGSFDLNFLVQAYRPIVGNFGSTARVEGKSLITALRGAQAAPLPSLV